jgi:hypothetical protein
MIAMSHNSPVIARRKDNRGFLVGTLLGVERLHGHRVYTVRTATGSVQRVSATAYVLSGR